MTDGFIKIGSIFQVIAYTLQAPELPFPVFVMASTLNGIGLALQVTPFGCIL